VQKPFFLWRKFTKKKNSNEVILEVLTTKSDGKILIKIARF
jgi:hypothetical protein